MHRDIAKVVLTGAAPSHAFTKIVLGAFESLGWQPVSAERAVEMLGNGTAADVVVRDRAGNILCVEIKTGMKHVFDGTAHDSGFMEAPMNKYRSCPVHHALLQAVVTSIMFQNTYKQPALPRVLLVNDEGARVFKLSPDKLSDFTNAAVQFLNSDAS